MVWLTDFAVIRETVLNSTVGSVILFNIPDEYGKLDFVLSSGTYDKILNFYFLYPIIVGHENTEITEHESYVEIKFLNNSRTVRVLIFGRTVEFEAYNYTDLFMKGNLYFNYETMSPIYMLTDLING